MMRSIPLLPLVLALGLPARLPAQEDLPYRLTAAVGEVLLEGIPSPSGAGTLDLWRLEVHLATTRATLLGAREVPFGSPGADAPYQLLELEAGGYRTLLDPGPDGATLAFVLAPHAEVGEPAFDLLAVTGQQMRCPCVGLREEVRWTWTREASEGVGAPGQPAVPGVVSLEAPFPAPLEVGERRVGFRGAAGDHRLTGYLEFPEDNPEWQPLGRARVARVVLDSEAPTGGATLVFRDGSGGLLGVTSAAGVDGPHPGWSSAYLAFPAEDLGQMAVELYPHVPALPALEEPEAAVVAPEPGGGLFGQLD